VKKTKENTRCGGTVAVESGRPSGQISARVRWAKWLAAPPSKWGGGKKKLREKNHGDRGVAVINRGNRFEEKPFDDPGADTIEVPGTLGCRDAEHD